MPLGSVAVYRARLEPCKLARLKNLGNFANVKMLLRNTYIQSLFLLSVSFSSYNVNSRETSAFLPETVSYSLFGHVIWSYWFKILVTTEMQYC
jgi:hypothetical protein